MGNPGAKGILMSYNVLVILQSAFADFRNEEVSTLDAIWNTVDNIGWKAISLAVAKFLGPQTSVMLQTSGVIENTRKSFVEFNPTPEQLDSLMQRRALVLERREERREAHANWSAAQVQMHLRTRRDELRQYGVYEMLFAP